ncbi:MAG: zinc ribbon domain-containing protein [bacterium]
MESTEKESVFKFAILIKSFEAFKQIKAIILLLITIVISAAIFVGTIGEATAIAYRSGALSIFVLGIGIIIASIIFLIGYTAAGKILMEFAKNKSSIKVSNAIIFSIFSFYKIIISEIILFIIPFIVALVILIYFLIARIPAIGSLLAFIGIPAFTIVYAIILLGIVLISFMIAPMVFEGNTVKEIFVKTYALFKKRSTLIFGYYIFISLVSFMAGIIFFALLTGSLRLTSGILTVTHPTYLFNTGGIGGGFSPYSSGFGYGNPMSSFMGIGAIQSIMMYGKFIGFGIAIIYMLLIVLQMVYMMLGQCYIYIDVIKDMDFNDAEVQFSSAASRVKSNIDKYKEKAANMSQRSGNNNNNNNVNNNENANTRYNNSNYSNSGNDLGNSNGNASQNQNNQNVNTNNTNSNTINDNKNDNDKGKICPKCGKENKPDANFCESCGEKLN